MRKTTSNDNLKILQIFVIYKDFIIYWYYHAKEFKTYNQPI